MTQAFVAYNNGHLLVRVESLKKYASNTEAVVNNATVTLDELLDSSGTDVLAGGPLPLDYIAASNGDYELSYLIELTPEAVYTSKVVAVADGLKKTWYPGLLIKKDAK